MTEHRNKSYSRILGREMEYGVFGDAGKLCFAFPPQNGRFYDFPNFGMVDVVRPWIDAGRLRIVCPDGIDGESWSSPDDNCRARIEMQEKWFHYIVDELLSEVSGQQAGNAGEGNDPCGKAMACGCSMGGVHAGVFFFRRPDLFDTMLSMSGLFNADFFFNGYIDDLVYANSPVHFLRNMPEDHPWMDLYRRSRIITCVGQGAWEDDMLAGTRELDAVLTEKNIPHWSDYWGHDVNHDWDWWQKQFPYFMEHILGPADG